ncbi:hypothetical protein L226DRAFT_326888 [Lentinus tigrinus ALCF2SS1-7]|uniref:uncharacterized protein n=1 Tax=Lentinus tigrinus ALCF2SS1-7 TaxID=1328758 RepID=UPI0011663E6A|nr:hypothetical protein L226DRAFT_326888 [Lentinus tigrinus ALCF2SS1-7]
MGSFEAYDFVTTVPRGSSTFSVVLPGSLLLGSVWRWSKRCRRTRHTVIGAERHDHILSSDFDRSVTSTSSSCLRDTPSRSSAAQRQSPPHRYRAFFTWSFIAEMFTKPCSVVSLRLFGCPRRALCACRPATRGRPLPLPRSQDLKSTMLGSCEAR